LRFLTPGVGIVRMKLDVAVTEVDGSAVAAFATACDTDRADVEAASVEFVMLNASGYS